MCAEFKAWSVYAHITKSQHKIRHLRQDLDGLSVEWIYCTSCYFHTTALIRGELILPFMLLSGCFNAEFGPLEHSLGQLHKTIPNCEPCCDLTAHSTGWCNVVYPYPRRRRPPLVTGYMEEAPEFGMLFSPQPDPLASWVVYEDEREDNGNTRGSGRVRAINSAARKPILCYGERRDHSSTGLFAQARSIDFPIPAVCIDFVISVTVYHILNSRHVLSRNSCGRWKPGSQEKMVFITLLF